jgi:hypothetical protein
MRVGLENKGAELVLASTSEAFGTYAFTSVVQNEVPGAIKEVVITGAAGGSQSGEITTSLFNATLTVSWKDFTTGKKTPAASKRCATAANVKPASNH